jgi:hypothetical protein
MFSLLRPRLAIGVVALAAVAACQSADSTSPLRASGSARADKGGVLPGSIGGPGLLVGAQGRLRGCTPRDAQYGTATIGPNGGDIVVGNSRLVIPPGALTQTVVITATSPAGDVPSVFFEPHGLQFKRSAGLILDVSNCTDVPSAVYINEIGVVGDPIQAVYSTLWHTVAAPIDHFSGYEVAF